VNARITLAPSEDVFNWHASSVRVLKAILYLGKFDRRVALRSGHAFLPTSKLTFVEPKLASRVDEYPDAQVTLATSKLVLRASSDNRVPSMTDEAAAKAIYSMILSVFQL
jgi:hypothetical protein